MRGVVHIQSRPTRGMSMANLLMVIAIMAVGAFALAGLTSSHLNMAQRQVHARDALYLAESALSQTIAQINRKNSFGLQKTEEVLVQPEARRMAIVTFNPARGYPASTTTMTDQDPGRGGNAHLVATASSFGVTRTVEALVGVPPFSYVVATAGDLVCSGGLTVRGMGGGPGNVRSNKSISVSGDCLVQGDIIATGPTCSVPTGAVYQRLMNNAPLVKIPDMDIDALNLDPRVAQASTALVINEEKIAAPGLDLQGAYYCEHDLEVQGSLYLDRSLLFVDGTLTVNGTVQGTGAVVVKNGDVVVKGTIDVARFGAVKSNIALLVEGNVTFQGTGSDYANQRKFFQGLVYTRGNFHADQVQIDGAFIQAPPKGSATPVSNATMALDRVTTTYLSQMTQITISVQSPGISANDLITFGGAIATNSSPGNLGPSKSTFVNQKFPELRDRLNNAIRKAVPPPFKPYVYNDGSVASNMIVLNVTPDQLNVDNDILKAVYNNPSYPTQEYPLVLSVGSYYDGNASEGAFLMTYDPVDGKFKMRDENDPAVKAHVREDGKLLDGFDASGREMYNWGDPVYAKRHYISCYKDDFGTDRATGWAGANLKPINTVGERYYGMPDMYQRMLKASRDAQAALANEMNDIMKEYGVSTINTTSQQITRDLNLNNFLGTSRPIMIQAWRER